MGKIYDFFQYNERKWKWMVKLLLQFNIIIIIVP